jgi:hypothetical protein
VFQTSVDASFANEEEGAQMRTTRSNFLMIWLIELYASKSLFQHLSPKRNCLQCCMRARNLSDEYISLKNWDLISIRRWLFITIIFKSYVFSSQKMLRSILSFVTST